MRLLVADLPLRRGEGGASVTPERETWLAERRRGIGGSDVAPILGLDSYRSPWDVWADKRGLVAPRADTERMGWGRRLEPLVLEAWAERRGLRLLTACSTLGGDWQPGRILRHPDHSYLCGTPDGLGWDTDRPLLVEAKTTSAWRGRGIGADGDEAGDETAPEAWRLQVWHYLYVCGLEHAELAVLIGGQEMRILPCPYDPIYETAVLPRLAAFWGHVEGGTEPPGGILAPERADPPPDMPEAAALAGAYHEAREAERAAADRKMLARGALVAAMGGLGRATAGPWALTRTVTTPAPRLDAEALRRDHPDLAARYTRQGGDYETLRVARRKDGH